MLGSMAHILNRTVLTSWDPESVFDYLLDFEHAEEWDAGTVSCRRTSGDGGVGTRYRNVSKFLGRRTTLDYEVEKVLPGQFVITGTNKTVEYRARMTFKGIAAVVSPLLAPFLKRLADDTEQQLRATLDAKAVA